MDLEPLPRWSSKDDCLMREDCRRYAGANATAYPVVSSVPMQCPRGMCFWAEPTASSIFSFAVIKRQLEFIKMGWRHFSAEPLRRRIVRTRSFVKWANVMSDKHEVGV